MFVRVAAKTAEESWGSGFGSAARVG